MKHVLLTALEFLSALSLLFGAGIFFSIIIGYLDSGYGFAGALLFVGGVCNMLSLEYLQSKARQEEMER